MSILRVRGRWFPASPEVVRPWLDRAWTGTADDLFPVDEIETARDNPEGYDPGALVPGVTRLAHGPLPFVFARGDPTAWEVRTPFGGRHGFSLRPDGAGCWLEHALEVDAPAPMRLLWWLCIRDGHDWAIEAIFDRLGDALRTGAIPARTARAMPWRARLGRWVLQRALPAGAAGALRRWLERHM